MIDTEVRHVTRPGANLFLELGFPPDEAAWLQASSQERIREALERRDPEQAESSGQ